MSGRSYDVIVLGAGAAGLFCAAEAAKRGRRVLVLERANRPGKKILISGGGRCNFTNTNTAPDRYLSQNPHFAKSALSRYTARDFIALVDSYGIAHHEKTLGQLFCDGSASQIVDLLLSECDKGQVHRAMSQEVESVSHADGRFRVVTQDAEASVDSLVIATGGPSIPKMGATDFAYRLARQFGLKVVEPRPALVPLTLSGEEALFRDLSGVSTEVVARAGKTRFREAALFTHRGLSGPAILQVSSYWRGGDRIGIDFLPDADADWLLDQKRSAPNTQLQTALKTALPARLAEALTERLDAPGALAEMKDKALRAVQERLSDWPFEPTGTEGFAKAEVTIGGISTAELSSKTMEAKRVPNLYAIGEAVDVTGWLGGYNFQWAWASAFAAGQAV
ncbi:MAG: NAD(P)/FAD-dependent oxidoreductase [Pacificimonas sp.]|jgi:predicted Rossmann fold flavoprotein|nr:NAD(P)/FAD-dependent oxidoreductase [Pacificimonas sp.]